MYANTYMNKYASKNIYKVNNRKESNSMEKDLQT